jgi:hypothetical protein
MSPEWTSERWPQLEADLREQHLRQEARLLGSTTYGQQYEIRAILKGPSGQAEVVSVWLVPAGQDRPRFVTTACPERTP